MFNSPNVYRKGDDSSNNWQTELPSKICGIDQVVWMSGRKVVYGGTGGTTTVTAPCLECTTRWVGQSAFNNSATLLNSTRATTTNYPLNNPDYWTGDTTNNYQPFLSFDLKSLSTVNRPNFLAIPYSVNFAELTTLTFSVIFRARQISPNSVTEPDDGSGQNVVLFQHGNDTIGNRRDGWGIDFATGSNELRVWYYDNTATGPVCDPGIGSGNSVVIPVSDWTKWLRLTVRISGNTMQANVYNHVEFAANSGFTWTNGCNNGSGSGIKYGVLWPANPDWFIGAQKGPDYPGTGADQAILAGSWDIAEYILYNEWLPDECVNTIWNYYDFRYDIPNVQPVPALPSPSAPAGSLLLDLDPSKEVYSDNGVTLATDGQDVYRWGDQSGGSNDALGDLDPVYSGLTKPSYHASGANNKPYVHLDWFDGAAAPFYNEWLVIDNSGAQFDVQEGTIVAVLNPYRTSPSTGYLINNSCSSGETVNADGWSIAASTVGDDVWSTNMQSVDPSAGSNYNNAPAYSGGELQVVVFRFSAGTDGHHFTQVNGDAKLSGSTVSSIDFGNTSDVLINGRFTESSNCSDPGIALGMYLYRLVMYDEYLDDTTVNNFISDLNSYHNIY